MVITDIPMTSAHILPIQCSEQFHNPGCCFYFIANVREDQRFTSQPTYKYPVTGSPGIQVQVLLTTSVMPFQLQRPASLPTVGAGQMCVELY